jgi:serine O-acetyltransferase
MALEQTDAAEAPTDKTPPPMPRGVSNCNPRGVGFWALVREDFVTHEREFLSQGFWAIAVHRFGNWRMGIRTRVLRLPCSLLYRFLYKLTQLCCGIDLPYTTQVGRRVKLEHFGGMILVARSIGDDVVIRQNTTFGVRNTKDLDGKPIIGNRVDIGAGAVLIGHIVIGDDAVIGANAVVVRDVPPGALAVGVPARVVQRSVG